MNAINWTNVKSALVSGVLTAVLAGAMYVIGVGNVFAINVHSLVNVVALGLLTSIVSLIKSLLTTDKGNFLGAVSIK